MPIDREPSLFIALSVFAQIKSTKTLDTKDETEMLQSYTAFSNAFKQCLQAPKGDAQQDATQLPKDFTDEVQNSAGEYFHYRGSLTSGTFPEVVTWLVFPQPRASAWKPSHSKSISTPWCTG